jgi:hypothetical protein
MCYGGNIMANEVGVNAQKGGGNFQHFWTILNNTEQYQTILKGFGFGECESNSKQFLHRF